MLLDRLRPERGLFEEILEIWELLTELTDEDFFLRGDLLEDQFGGVGSRSCLALQLLPNLQVPFLG